MNDAPSAADPGAEFPGASSRGSRVFVSYAHDDEELAHAVALDIEAFGHSVFIDKQVVGGEDWWDRILDEIERCDHFFVVVSPHWRSSLACRREHFHAVQLSKHILGIANGSVPPVALDLLGPTQIINQYAARDGLKRLERALRDPPLRRPVATENLTRPLAPKLGAKRLERWMSTQPHIHPQHQSEILEELAELAHSKGDPKDAITALRILRQREELEPGLVAAIDREIGTGERRIRRRKMVAPAIGMVALLGLGVVIVPKLGGGAGVSGATCAPLVKPYRMDLDSRYIDGQGIRIAPDPKNPAVPDPTRYAMMVNGAAIPLGHGLPKDLAYAPLLSDGTITEEQYQAPGSRVPRDNTLLRYRHLISDDQKPGRLFLALGGAVFPVSDPNSLHALHLDARNAIMIPPDAFWSDEATPRDGTRWKLAGKDQVWVMQNSHLVPSAACVGKSAYELPNDPEIFDGITRIDGRPKYVDTLIPRDASPTFSAESCVSEKGQFTMAVTVGNADVKRHKYRVVAKVHRPSGQAPKTYAFDSPAIDPGSSRSFAHLEPDPISSLYESRCQFSAYARPGNSRAGR